MPSRSRNLLVSTGESSNLSRPSFSLLNYDCPPWFRMDFRLSNREEGRGTAARCPQQGKRHGFFALVKEGVARARVATCVLGCVKALNTFGDTSY